MEELVFDVKTPAELSLLAAVISAFDKANSDERLQLVLPRDVEVRVNALSDPKVVNNVRIDLCHNNGYLHGSGYRIADLPNDSATLSELESFVINAVNRLLVRGGQGFESGHYVIRAV